MVMEMKNWEKILLVVSTVVLAFILNAGFLKVEGYTTGKILSMNDIASIKLGYEQTPNLLIDGLRWWRGEWIQVGIAAFRPVSSYLYWLETHLWLHQGFIWTAWIGFVLFSVNCLLSGVLAWQLTQSKICAFGAAILATTVRFHNPGQPDIWLGWYPVHQDLMMNALMLGGIASFYQWFSTGERKWLPLSWVLFIVGSLSKEHVYVFPLFATVIVVFGQRRNKKQIPLKSALGQVALMFLTIIGLWVYRAEVIDHPRNPSLKWNQLIYKPGIFLFSEFAGYLFQRIQVKTGVYKEVFLSKDSWMPGLSLVFFVGIGATVKLRQKFQNRWVSLPVCSMVIMLITAGFLGTYGPISDIPGAVNTFDQRIVTAIMTILDHPFAKEGLRMVIWMTMTFYFLYLLWMYRRDYPSLEAFGFLYLAYLPVLDYIGWHYTTPAWFVWSVYWVMIWKLVYTNLAVKAPPIGRRSFFCYNNLKCLLT